MNYRYLYFLGIIAAISFAYSSCTGLNRGNVSIANIIESDCKVIDISSEIDNELLDISDLAYDINVVKLETTESSLVGEIRQLVFGSNYIYILDYNNNVLIFDINGFFVKSFKHGNGPGEIDRVIDIMFNKYDKHLYIYQYAGVNVYSEDGVFIDSHPSLALVTDYLPLCNGNYLGVVSEMQNGTGNYCFYEIDSLFDVTNVRIVDPEVKPEWGIPHYVHYSVDREDELVVSRPFDNRILSYFGMDNSIYVKYKFDLKNKDLDLSSISGPIDYETLFNLLQDESKYCFSGNYYENDNYLCLYFKKGSIYISELYYNKTTSKIRCGYSRDVGIPNSGFVTSVYNGSFVKELSPESFYKDTVFLNRVKTSFLISTDDKDKILSSTPDDNPLLVFFKLKDIPANAE